MRKTVRAAIARGQDRRAGQLIRQLGIAAAMDEAGANTRCPDTDPVSRGMAERGRTPRVTASLQDRAEGAPKGYPVEIDHSAPGTAYLIEFSFCRDQAPSVRLFNAAGLAQFLTDNEEHRHYTGDWAEVAGMWRYDENGGLVKLVVNSRAGRTDEGDYIHTDYVVREEGETAKVEFAFTVTFDGRV